MLMKTLRLVHTDLHDVAFQSLYSTQNHCYSYAGYIIFINSNKLVSNPVLYSSMQFYKPLVHYGIKPQAISALARPDREK